MEFGRRSETKQVSDVTLGSAVLQIPRTDPFDEIDTLNNPGYHLFIMPATLSKITHDALELPQQARAKLAHRLIVSIDQGADKEVAPAWDAEIKRRVDDIRSGKVKGIPAKEVFAKLRSKYH